MNGSDIKIPAEVAARIIITLEHTKSVTHRACMTLGHVKSHPTLLHNLMESITENHRELELLSQCLFDSRAAMKQLYIQQELEVDHGED
jgi:hypothetical protein